MNNSIKFIFSFGLCLALGLDLSAAQHSTKMRWATYRSRLLNVQMTVPAAWVARKSTTALGFRSPGPNSDQIAAVGIMKSSEQTASLDDNADHLLKDAGNPSDWTRSYARVSGLRAVKIIGSVPNLPGRKFVQYFVETPNGTYLLQCFAPRDLWPLYSPLFARIVSQLQFPNS